MKAYSLHWPKYPPKGDSCNSFKTYCYNSLASCRITSNTNLPEIFTTSLFLASKPDLPNDAKALKFINTESLDCCYASVTASCITILSLKISTAAAIGLYAKESDAE